MNYKTCHLQKVVILPTHTSSSQIILCMGVYVYFFIFLKPFCFFVFLSSFFPLICELMCCSVTCGRFFSLFKFFENSSMSYSVIFKVATYIDFATYIGFTPITHLLLRFCQGKGYFLRTKYCFSIIKKKKKNEAQYSTIYYFGNYRLTNIFN